MTHRRALMGSAGLKSPLLAPDGRPITADTVKVTIRSMPLIDPQALPGLPDDLEARLFNVPGQDPFVILFHPLSELYVEMSLLDRDNIAQYVEALSGARLKQAMGEVPENAEGYRIDG